MAATFVFTVMNWNIQNFGSYQTVANGGLEWIADTILNSKADIVIVEELFVNRQNNPKTSIQIDSQAPTQDGIDAANGLLLMLRNAVKDPGANWALSFSNNNCGNKDRDAYAIYYKKRPSASAYKITPPAGLQIPTTISIKGAAIKVYDEKGYGDKTGNPRKMDCSSSRRPGGAKFEFSDGGPNTVNCIILGFHAIAPEAGPTKIKKAIKECVYKAGTASTSNDPSTENAFIIGGDFNLSYNGRFPKKKNSSEIILNSDFYKDLEFYDDKGGTYKVETAITANGASSLRTNVGVAPAYKYKTDNAYDNLLYHGVAKVSLLPCKIIDVIAAKAAVYQSPPGNLSKKDAIERAFDEYRTSRNGVVSDHLPAICSFKL